MSSSARLSLILIAGIILLAPFYSAGQDSIFPKAIDISEFNYTKSISGKINIELLDVSKKIQARFELINKSDSSRDAWFFPGFFVKKIQLYRLINDKPEEIISELPGIPDSIGFRKLTLAPKESIVYMAGLELLRTRHQEIELQLIQPGYLDLFLNAIHARQRNSDLLTYVFCGLLLMMILFSLTNFLQGSKISFLYYACYAFLIGLLLFSRTIYAFHFNQIHYFLEEYLDYILQGLGVLCYVLFMQNFLQTKPRYPFLHRLCNLGIIIQSISLVAYSIFHFFSKDFIIEYYVEQGSKFLLIGLLLFSLVYSLGQWSSKSLRYIFFGNFFLFAFILISVCFAAPGLPLYIEIGLLLQLGFFLAAINYKSRQKLVEETREREALKAENKLKEFEKELAVFKAQQDERERIAADIHDELGSGMTAIRLLSEISRKKLNENTPVEIEKIAQSADEVLNKMHAIIWSMNSVNDSLESLALYIKDYSQGYFEHSPINCSVFWADPLPAIELGGERRRNIILCVKEVLTNAWKHSGCDKMTIDIITGSQLEIRITDNGKWPGDYQSRRFGNGLKNIERRMKSIGGSFRMQNQSGTISTLILPV